MSDFVTVPHNSIKNLCFTIHGLINSKQKVLDDTLKAEEISPIRKAIAGSLFVRNDLDDLNRLLALALECAPDDIRNFFRNYEEICDACPF